MGRDHRGVIDESVDHGDRKLCYGAVSGRKIICEYLFGGGALLVQNAELLDQDVMDKKLVQWLDKQCGLDQLAHTLYAMLNQKVSASAFAGTILSYVNLYPHTVVEQTEAVIRANEGLSPWERRKAKADFLLTSRRYFSALRQYHALLAELPEEERLQQYLAAIRLHDSDKEYVAFVAEHPEFHDASLRVERMMEQSYGQFEGTDENRMLFTLQICKEEGSGNGNNVAYYDEIEKLTVRLKEQYREFTS